MKKVKKILPVLAILFFCIILFFSFILLNRNKYGVFELNNKLYVNISSENDSKTYKKGSLVILNKTTLKDLKESDEVFLYKQNEKTKQVQLLSSKVKEIDLERSAIVATHDGKYYSEQFIAGTPNEIVPFWGGFFNLVLSRWFFFIFILIPAFAIVVYEIYLLFINIKYGDDEDEEENEEDNSLIDPPKQEQPQEEVKEQVETKTDAQVTEEKPQEVVEEQKEETSSEEIIEETTVEEEKTEEKTETVEETIENNEVKETETTQENKEPEEAVEELLDEPKQEETVEEQKEEIPEDNNVVNVDVEELTDINTELEEEKKEKEQEDILEEEKKN